MEHNKTIDIFSQLSHKLTDVVKNINGNQYSQFINDAIAFNKWFTTETINTSLEAIANSLQKEKITQWLSKYDFTNNTGNKNIGLILAGNLPLVGFHDILCCLITGNNVIAKLSSKDQALYKLLKSILVEIDESYDSKLTFTEGFLKNTDAIIATGSNNSSRYFEYYFGKYPNIIRKNRNSIAILTGHETKEDLERLGHDIFTYYGLGCRNVSQIWIPENYSFDHFFKGIEKFSQITDQVKYANNYDYQKAILLMNKIQILDNGFTLLRNETNLNSPIGVVHYSYYNSEKQIEEFVQANKHKIQCIVSKTNWSFKTYGLGEAQKPELWDYADDIDTIDFLLNLK